MKRKHIVAIGFVAIIAAAPLPAAVKITSITPSVASPKPLGTPITWTVKATNSSSGNLTFQFSVGYGKSTPGLVSDFNIGTLASGTWTSQPFVWNTIAGEGTFTIQVVAKDFVSGESATGKTTFQLNSRVSKGVAGIFTTGNPLVALFSSPACPSGSTMRVAFYTGTASPNYTTWAPCTAVSMNFYVAGMLPNTTYFMYSQTATNSTVVNGDILSFTTGSIPSRVDGGFFPSFKVITAAPSNDPDPMLLWAFTKIIIPVATDLNGNIMWFYANGKGTLLTRPVAGGTLLTIQNGVSWDSSNQFQQMLQEIDLAGNTIRETNTGIISHQLVTLGATDATPCGAITQPKVGDACLNDFHHDAIRLPNGNTAFMAHIEKLFAPGTQGSTTGDPVDILSEMVIVLDKDWQVVWYYDAFNELNLNRVAPLGETCSGGESDCPTKLFLSTECNDWTHGNTVDYVAASPSANKDAGNFLVSMRNQDQVIGIEYKNGAGSCAPPPAASCIAWYMGPADGDAVPPDSYAINNFTNDPWPWFSHQHDVTYANSGDTFTIDGLTGPLLTVFDNGNTRYSAAPLGLGSACGPNDCNSRGMALIVDQTNMRVTPVMLQDLGIQSTALGAAQWLTGNNYYYQTGIPETAGIQLAPAASASGSQVLNIGSVDYSYRSWQMPNLYNPPVL